MPTEDENRALLSPRSREGTKAVQAIGNHFVSHDLGVWSSHPLMANQRLKTIRWIAVSLVSAMLLYAAWRVIALLPAALSPSKVVGTAITAVSQVVSDRKWVLLTIAVALSATLTAGLTIQAGLSSGTVAPSRKPRFMTALCAWYVIGVFVVCGAAAWLGGTRLVDVSIRWWVLVAALLPFSALLFWFNLFTRLPPSAQFEDGDDDRATKFQRSVTFARTVRTAITPVLLTASSLLISPAVAKWVTGLLGWGLLKLAGTGFAGGWLSRAAGFLTDTLASMIVQTIGMFIVTAVAGFAISRIACDVRAAALQVTQVDHGASPADLTKRRSSLFRSLLGGIWTALKSVLSTTRRLWRWFLRRGADREESQTDSLDGEFVLDDALRDRLLESGRRTVHPELTIHWIPSRRAGASPDEDAKMYEFDDLNWLFGGERPTHDEYGVLQAFDDRWREHAAAVELGKYGEDRQSHADLFVESRECAPELTMTLRACALFACVARGQRVLFLVADDATRRDQIAELRAALGRFGFDSLFRVGSLDPSEVSEWCPAPGAASVGDNLRQAAEPPDILIATPSDYDATMLSGAFDAVLIRAFLLSIEVIVIDGLQRLTSRDAWLLHLPFLIDKHRLLLRNENRCMQLVLGSKPISQDWTSDDAVHAVSRDRLAMRLFGGDGRVKGHFVSLRRRFRPSPSVLEVRVPKEALEVASQWLNATMSQVFDPTTVAILASTTQEATLNVAALDMVGKVGISKDGDPDGAETTTEAKSTSPLELRDGGGRSGGRATERPKGDLLRLSLRAIERDPDATLGGCKWLIIPRNASVVDRRGVRSVLASRPFPTIVEVVETAVANLDNRAARSDPLLPVFVSANAPAMFLPHLRSAIPAMRADAPTRREDFARFGIAWDEQRWRTHASAMHPSRLHEGWQLQLDGALSHLAAEGSMQFVWPAVLVRRNDAVRWNEVRLEAPPNEGLCLMGDASFLEIGQDSTHTDLRRHAVWMNSRELILGTSDLFLSSQLVWKSDRQEYRPMLFRPLRDATQIEAEPKTLEGDDFVIPKCVTAITLPVDMGVDGPYAVRGARACLFRVRESSKPLVTTESSVGLMTADGAKEIACRRIDYTVHVSVTLVVLGQSLASDGTDIGEEIRAAYEGAWTTVRGKRRGPRETWPLMAKMVREAVEQCAPDLLRFARVFAFRPPYGHSGASLLFIETAATARSALDAFKTLLDDRVLRTRFICQLRESIKSTTVPVPCVGVEETQAEHAESLRDALVVVEELEDAEGLAPTLVGTHDGVLAKVCSPDSGRPQFQHVAVAPESVLGYAEGAHVWTDEFLSGGSAPIQFTLSIEITRAQADVATRAFGWQLGEGVPIDAAALRMRCVRQLGTHTIGPDYEEMIARSVAAIQPVADDLLKLAVAAGIVRLRDQIRLFTGFVQATKYLVSHEGELNDGVERFGVQMPVETLVSRVGDCDSSALLLVALLRATRVVRSGLMLVENESSGHAMAVVCIDPVEGDHIVRSRDAEFVPIECTGRFAIGYCADEYVGRNVRLVALG